MDDTARSHAHASLESTIEQYAKYRLEPDEVVTDAVLLLAAQHVDEDGDRCGRVFVFPRHGYQPVYITKGMLSDALDMVRHAQESANE
ncbi:DUF7213 family protein [Mycobacterium avium]